MPYKSYDDNPFDDYQGYDQYGSDIEALMNRLIGQQRMIQATVKDEIDRTMTQITQTADEIRQEVSDFENDVYSEISQTADSITQTITNVENGLQSQITQNANGIAQRVTSSEAESLFLQLADTFVFSADQIDFIGTTNFTLGDGSNGRTRVTGGRINADTIATSSVFFDASLGDSGGFASIDLKLDMVSGLGWELLFGGSVVLNENNWSEIISLSASDIPNLGASKITSGTFNTNRIPNLPASRITTGTFNSNRIPNLDASKITSGTFNENRIPTGMSSYVGSTFGANISVSINSDRLIVRQDGTITHRIPMNPA